MSDVIPAPSLTPLPNQALETARSQPVGAPALGA